MDKKVKASERDAFRLIEAMLRVRSKALVELCGINRMTTRTERGDGMYRRLMKVPGAESPTALT